MRVRVEVDQAKIVFVAKLIEKVKHLLTSNLIILKALKIGVDDEDNAPLLNVMVLEMVLYRATVLPGQLRAVHVDQIPFVCLSLAHF